MSMSELVKRVASASRLLTLAENSLWRAKEILIDIEDFSSIAKRIGEICSEIREINQRLKLRVGR